MRPPSAVHVALHRLAGYLAVAIASFAAYRSIRAAWADGLARSSELHDVVRAVRLAPENARYWIALANLEELGDSSAGAAREEDALTRARELNPYDASIWIRSGLRAESRGELARAETFLLRAELLSRQCEPQTMLANFYYRSGDAMHFWPRVKLALACATEDRKPLFDLCWSMNTNASFLLRAAIPDVPPARRDFLQYLLSHNQLDAAETASIPVAARAEAVDRELLLRYTDRMADAGRWNAALLGWNALCERKILPYEPLDRTSGPWVTNEHFGTLPLNTGFDWNISKVEGVSVSWRPPPNGLRIEFSGEPSEEGEIMRQFIPVRPVRPYVLKGAYTISGIAAGSGLRLRLTDTETGTEIASAALNGDSLLLSFKTPVKGSALRMSLEYRRTPGTTRIEGSIILNGFSLEAQR